MKKLKFIDKKILISFKMQGDFISLKNLLKLLSREKKLGITMISGTPKMFPKEKRQDASIREFFIKIECIQEKLSEVETFIKDHFQTISDASYP
jgi:hypothetical protein